MGNAILQIEAAGIGSFDVRTKQGLYAGVLAPRKDGTYRVYFNGNCTRGSQRKFNSVNDAISFIIERRVKKGWRV
jgi:hypothetical protein